jgi:hypothetical protein
MATAHSPQERVGRGARTIRQDVEIGRIEPQNPRRIAADKLNARKRVGFTEDGLARIREAGPFSPPWRYSAGPRTVDGKAWLAIA